MFEDVFKMGWHRKRGHNKHNKNYWVQSTIFALENISIKYNIYTETQKYFNKVQMYSKIENILIWFL